jgi:hypothetical protein
VRVCFCFDKKVRQKSFLDSQENLKKLIDLVSRYGYVYHNLHLELIQKYKIDLETLEKSEDITYAELVNDKLDELVDYIREKHNILVPVIVTVKR